MKEGVLFALGGGEPQAQVRIGWRKEYPKRKRAEMIGEMPREICAPGLQRGDAENTKLTLALEGGWGGTMLPGEDSHLPITTITTTLQPSPGPGSGPCLV